MSVITKNVVKTNCFVLSNRLEGCEPIFIKSNTFDFGNMFCLLGCLDFKFEELVNFESIMSTKAVADILVRFFGFEYISGYQLKQVQQALPSNFTPSNYSWATHTYTDKITVISIDRFYAREYCCNLNYHELMAIHMPLNLELFNAIKQAEKVQSLVLML